MSDAAPSPADHLPPPVLVEDAAGMERLLDELAGAREIAFDTEGDSFYHYEERVCLVQISIPGRDYLVDPLQDLDLSGIGDVLADPARTKVFHDGEYDVRILKKCFGFSFAGLFDTRVAAAALGWSSPGLASVVERLFDVSLDKSLQRSNWSSRPLTKKQIEYARLDTHYLIELRRRFVRELEERGRLEILEGECRRLEALEPATREFHPDEFLRLKGARNLDRQEMSVLRELFVLRDRLARQRDLPPFKIFSNHVLLEMARKQPTSLPKLQRVERMSPKLVKRWGTELVGAVKEARSKGPLKQVPRLPPKDGSDVLDEASYELHERLKEWRKRKARGDEMDASLVLNRHALARLAVERPRDEAALAGVEGLLPWQVEAFGDELLAVVDRFEQDLAAGRVPLNDRLRRRRRTT